MREEKTKRLTPASTAWATTRWPRLIAEEHGGDTEDAGDARKRALNAVRIGEIAQGDLRRAVAAHSGRIIRVPDKGPDLGVALRQLGKDQAGEGTGRSKGENLVHAEPPQTPSS